MSLRPRSFCAGFLAGFRPSARIARAIGLAAIGSLLCGVPSSRADVSVRVVGTVSSVSGGTGLEFEDPVEVTYTVRPGRVAADANPAADIGDYLDATQGFTAEFGPGILTVTCTGTRTFVNDNVSGPVPLPANHDRLTFRGEGCVDSFGGMLADSAFNVRVIDTTATSITGDDLSDGVVLDLVDAANTGQFTLSCGNETCDPGYGMSVRITGVSIVPEPGVAACAFTILFALAHMRRAAAGGFDR